jgi:hypothetical protein
MKKSEAIRKQLKLLGIAPHMAGYRYLEQAVALWRPGCMVTKEIYPDIAKHNRTTFAAVERGIRCAIKYAWDYQRGNLGAIYETFGLWAIHTRPKPAELIAAVAIWAGAGEGGETDED